MSGMSDIDEIKQVKYRYLRALDTKNWDEFADTLTEDVRADYGTDVAGQSLHFTERNALVDYMRRSLGPETITEHHVGHPEITLDDDQATGTWYLQDRVIVPAVNFMLIGAAFYHDTYCRTSAGWKICGTGYDRTYDATMSLQGLNFTLKTGSALHI
jgi:SnoaL-like domain